MSSTTVARDMADTALSSSSTIHARPIDDAQPRKSARFEQIGGSALQSTKSSHGVLPPSDEGTPIKSDDQIHRSYNTSATTLPVTSPANAATNVMSRQSSGSETSKSGESTSWWKNIAEKYGSVTLENKASVARDHLALERTFLAWLRTSLSFASIGIAITQLFRLNTGFTNSASKRSLVPTSSSSDLPFSPYVGHAIPPEVIPYLQHAALNAAPIVPTPELGPTLLDQMLGLAMDGSSVHSNTVFSTADTTDNTGNRLRAVGKPLGATFIGISVLVLLVGFQRYFEAQHWIIHGKFPASRGSISIVAFSACALVIASLVIIVVISPDQYET